MTNVPQKSGVYFARSGKPPQGWAEDAYDLIVKVSGTAPFLSIEGAIDSHTLEAVNDVWRDPKVWGPELALPRIGEAEAST